MCGAAFVSPCIALLATISGTLALPLTANAAVASLGIPNSLNGADGINEVKPAIEPTALATPSYPVCGAPPTCRVVKPDIYPDSNWPVMPDT